jgi:hypothetical protein
MPSRSRAPGSGPPLTGMPSTASQSRDALTTPQRTAAASALSEISGATIRTAGAVLIGAQPAEIRARINAIRARLNAAEQMDGIR